jgi:proton-translocating NADH-quinone oxidoreductase chain L
MLLVVSGVSSLVHLYSMDYMSSDPHQGRFIGYLSLFTFFMLILVSADNFLIMFLGWEGIGLASFLLIGFWFNRIQAGKSAFKAMIVNRIGDCGLAAGICLIFLTFKSIDYFVVFSSVDFIKSQQFAFLSFSFDKSFLISFLLFWGALGKSAQLGLHIWLPDAMEGPTPVSALIHAATLVTAGVFLIIRSSSLFASNDSILFILTLFGSLTAFFASSVGLVQSDLKRVIAYSTCSQLGYMIFTCGLSSFSVAIFHLANHAVFKALLFLSAGCILHGLADEQDMRRMGALITFIPSSYSMVLIGTLAIIGFPFLTGFYSKDSILEITAAKQSKISNFAYILGVSAAFCTSFYSFRLLFLVFCNSCNAPKRLIEGIHEGSIILLFPLFVLALGSISLGFLSKDLMIGLGTPVFYNSIYTPEIDLILIDSEFLPSLVKNIPLILTIAGFISSFLFINCYVTSKVFSFNIKLTFRSMFIFLSKKWFFDQIFGSILHRSMNFGYKTSFLLLDKGLVEHIGPTGLSYLNFSFANWLYFFQSGFLFHYNLIVLFSFLTFLVFFINYFLVLTSIFKVFIIVLSLSFLLLF